MLDPTDRAALASVIVSEQASVAHYAAMLRTDATRAQKARWRALRAYHQAQIKRRKGELKG